MTDNHLPAAGPPQRSETLPPASADEPGPADVVRDQAPDLRRSGVQAGKHVADARPKRPPPPSRDEAASSAHHLGNRAQTARDAMTDSRS